MPQAGGYCAAQGVFTACGAGTYSSATGKSAISTCENCPAGTYSAAQGFFGVCTTWYSARAAAWLQLPFSPRCSLDTAPL